MAQNVSKYNPIAVAVIHGVGKQKPDFAEEIKAKLIERFVERLPSKIPNPHTQIVIEPFTGPR